MKTISKTFFLTLSGLLIFVLISLVILGWIVFTPSKLTPIVGKYADKYIPYSNKFGEVELTFYKTFPNFGIRIKDFSIISKNDELSENTLLSVNELIAEIDALALWKNNELIITKFNFNDGELNIFIDSLGHSNYELFLNEAENNSESSSDPGLNFIKLNNIEFKNFDLSYIDISSKQNASLKKIKAILSGEYHNDKIKALIRLNNAITSFSYDGEKYLDSTEILLKIPLEINLDSQLVKLKNAFASVDGSSFTLNGSMENDTIQNLLITDLHFNTDPWRLEKIIDLIPAGYLEEYNSIDLSGEISLEGSIFGFFSDSIMPLIKLDLSLNEVSFNYDYLPFP